MGGSGGQKREEEHWKPTAVYYWGSKSSSQEEEMPDLDFCLPRYDVDPQFSGVERMAEHCGHCIAPARRVCNEGMDIGRRFLGCQYEDFRACGYVKWIDPEWDCRAKTVISDLARKNDRLKKEVEKKDAEKNAEKEKHKLEKKIIARINKEQMMCRDRMLFFAISVCFGLCVIMFAMAGKK